MCSASTEAITQPAATTDQDGLCGFFEWSSRSDLFWPVHSRIAPPNSARIVYWWRCLSVCSTCLHLHSWRLIVWYPFNLSPSSSDFLSNLLVLLIRILNSGISDSGLTMHLSEATAGSLSGVGHSTAYEEISTYTYVPHGLFFLMNLICWLLTWTDRHTSLAVKYLFLTNHGLNDEHPDLVIEPFNAAAEQNDYEVRLASRL